MKRCVLLAAVTTSLATPAIAHTGQHLGFGLTEGALHPIQGADHLAQMVLVGLLAARLGGNALLLLPVAFVSAMIAGAFLVRPEFPTAVIEGGITLGLLAAGLLAATRNSVALPVASTAVAIAGLLHGMAHGVEAPQASFLSYVAGFAATTALLHAIGVAAGIVILRHLSPGHLRLAGAAVAIAGVAGSIG